MLLVRTLSGIGSPLDFLSAKIGVICSCLPACSPVTTLNENLIKSVWLFFQTPWFTPLKLTVYVPSGIG